MAACEKCWSDAFFLGGSVSQAEKYSKLVEIRIHNPCTPEQQAGVDALVCELCKRKCMHPVLKECMNSDCIDSKNECS